MEIIDPNDIYISKSLGKTLSFISNGIYELNAKDLTDDQREKIRISLMVPSIRSSLGIEDIRASARQTKDVLDFYRINHEVKEGKGNQEIINLQDANEFICSDYATSSPLSNSFIQKLHFEVTKDSGVRGAGNFKDRPNEFKDGTPTPLPVAVPGLIEDVSIYFEASDMQDPIVLACWLHNMIAKIHPFNDGNGRTSRTLQDWVLYKNRYLPCSTGTINKLTYYDILEEADDGNWEPMIEQIAQAQSDSLAVAMQSIEASEGSRLTRKLVLNMFNAKNETKDDHEYHTWRYQANLALNAFETECEKWNETLSDTNFSCHFIRNEVISKQNWKLIKQDGWANSSNAFLIYFSQEGEAFYKTIGYYARHFLRDTDSGVMKNYKRDMKDMVSIYLGGHDEPAEVDIPAKAKKLKSKTPGEYFAQLPWEDEKISIREILITESKFFQYQYITRWLKAEFIDKGIKLDLNSEHEEWIPKVADPQEIATQYIGEMFMHKAGLAD
jgi:Fic family protein